MTIFDEAMKAPLSFNTVELDGGALLVYRRDSVIFDFKPNWDLPTPKVDVCLNTRVGGVVNRRSLDRVLTVIPEPSMPSGLPGVEAMLADGWMWDGWHDHFVRDDSGSITLARVRSGRYAKRLPTNRKRARARRKQR